MTVPMLDAHRARGGSANFGIVRLRDFLDQPLDDVFGRHPFRLGLKIGAHSVPQHGDGDPSHVVNGHRKPPIHGRQGLATVDQKQAGPRAGPPIDQFPDKFRGRFVIGACGPHQSRYVFHHIFADRHRSDQLLQVHYRAAREDFAHLHFLVAAPHRQNPFLFVRRRVADLDVEHEPVQLRFGQRIGSFLLDRVLRGDGEERVGQLVCLASDRNLPFLHRLQQSGLRLGRRAVDFVGQQDVREDRPFHEPERDACPARLPPARWCR